MSVIDGEQFWALFEGFMRSAWRLETQPTYTIPSEQADLARFLAGEPEPVDHNAEWHEQVRAWVSVGKTVSRVRVLTNPVTDYQRYQFAWSIPGNTAAGEQVRILDAARAAEAGLPTQDFWIFDNHFVVHLNFTAGGELVGRELIDNPDLDLYLGWRDAAVTRSVPLRDWQDART